MDGAEVAALDTLQHCLPGHAEGRRGDLDGNPAGGGVVGDEIPDGSGEADAPGGAGGDLLAGDESVGRMARRQRPKIAGVTVYKRGATWSYRLDLGPEPLTGDRQRENKGGFDSEDAAGRPRSNPSPG